MDGGGGHPRLLQVPGHFVGPVLGAGEHQGVLHPQLPHQVGQQAGLVVLVHKIHALLNGLHRGGDGVHRHPGGVVEQRVHQVPDLRGHGGGEEQGLLLPGQPLQDLLHVVDKAHVQHPVRLVQDEDVQIVQTDKALVVEVHQPPGGGDKDVHAPAQGLHLGVLAHAAEDDGVAQGQIFAIGLKALADLDGQLPGGGEHQCPDGVAGDGLGGEPLENGGCEGAGLARARLGAAQHVPARQGGGDGFLLDGGGGVIAHLPQCV